MLCRKKYEEKEDKTDESHERDGDEAILIYIAREAGDAV